MGGLKYHLNLHIAHKHIRIHLVAVHVVNDAVAGATETGQAATRRDWVVQDSMQLPAGGLVLNLKAIRVL